MTWSPRWLLLLVSIVELPGASPLLAQRVPDYNRITPPRDPNASRLVWRIDRPNPRRRVVEYPAITFRRGDLVTVRAGGCVDRGGSGGVFRTTTYRYVDPEGGNSGSLYSGLIDIPGGGTAGLVRIGSVARRQNPNSTSGVSQPLAITRDPSPAYLRLGYEDTEGDYDDNSYHLGNSDNGQCDDENKIPAWVTIVIERGAATGPQNTAGNKPFDLVYDDVDDNGLPYLPRWRCQADKDCWRTWLRDPALADSSAFVTARTRGEDLLEPTPIVCDSGDMSTCTAQAPSADNGPWCTGWIAGHQNWFPVTYTGQLEWLNAGKGQDWDTDILIRHYDARGVYDPRGVTTKGELAVQIEFDMDETATRWGSRFWRSFYQRLFPGGKPGFNALGQVAQGNDAYARRRMNGHDAVVLGLFGLDFAHGGHAELHPAFLFAFRENDTPSTTDDRWAFFVRNAGNEGSCGSKIHRLDLPQITLRIPAPTDLATGVAFSGGLDVWATDARHASISQVTFAPAQGGLPGGALVTFGLPSPSALTDTRQGVMIDGELPLRWTVRSQSPVGLEPMGQRRAKPALLTAGDLARLRRPPLSLELAGQRYEEGEGLGPLVRGLTVAQRRALDAFDPGAPVADGKGPLSPAAITRAPVVRLDPRKRYSTVADTATDERRRRLITALCAAHAGKVPGSPRLCK